MVNTYRIPVKGILHIGANYCQENDEYIQLTDSKHILWVEANPSIVDDVKRTSPSIQIFQGLLTDTDNDTMDFKITNNEGQSSSIFEFGTHKVNHPTINFVKRVSLQTQTLDTFIQKHGTIVPNILVLDVQGAELLVLRGGRNTLQTVDLIYTEINTGYTYVGCGLVTDIDSLLLELGFRKVFQRVWDGHTYGDAVYVRSVFLS